MIDSHVHLTHYRFENMFPFLGVSDSNECVRIEGTRDKMIKRMEENGITAVIEPAISFFSNEKILSFAKDRPDFVYAAIGRHPKDCYMDKSPISKGVLTAVKWKDRKKLDQWAGNNRVVAIGETGLDYHHTQDRKHKRLQRRWFVYQIKLAHKHGLPLILHIRKADHDALRILKRYRHKLHGGVVHCFCGNAETAKEYLKLGFCLGIGGSLLREVIASNGLREAVQSSPIERIIIETDSPYVLPDKTHFSESERIKKLRNSPLLLPMVIGEIAKIKGLTYETVECAVLDNTIALFGLNQKQRESCTT